LSPFVSAYQLDLFDQDLTKFDAAFVSLEKSRVIVRLSALFGVAPAEFEGWLHRHYPLLSVATIAILKDLLITELILNDVVLQESSIEPDDRPFGNPMFL
jgi:hypothetical protein